MKDVQMREIIHDAYEMLHDVQGDISRIDYCFVSNLEAPIGRTGAEPFKSYYPIEWAYFGYNIIDPSRSFAQIMIDRMKMENDAVSHWPAADIFVRLIHDLGFNYHDLTRADLIAFWTMFPVETADFLAHSYFKRVLLLTSYPDAVRVLNNPWFYNDSSSSERRLVEIAEVNGFRFALDRSKFLPEPDVVAKEIALLNHGVRNPERVDEVTISLTSSIAATMEDWGLVPRLNIPKNSE
jgi:hypothetical protein